MNEHQFESYWLPRLEAVCDQLIAFVNDLERHLHEDDKAHLCCRVSVISHVCQRLQMFPAVLIPIGDVEVVERPDG